MEEEEHDLQCVEDVDHRVEWHEEEIPETVVILVIVMSLPEDEMVDLHLEEQVECLVVDQEVNHVDAVEDVVEEDHLENRKENQEALLVEEDGNREEDKERKDAIVMMINMTIMMMNTMNHHEEEDLQKKRREERREENREVELVHLLGDVQEAAVEDEAEVEDVVVIVAVWTIWTWKWKNAVREEEEPEEEEDAVVVEVPIAEMIHILKMIWILHLAVEEAVAVEPVVEKAADVVVAVEEE